MIRILATLSLLLSLVSAATTLGDANRAFADGNFQAAAESYESLIAEHGPDSSLYYNLGNARQKLGQTGPAVLAYERALLLSPRDPDLIANLALARKQAAIFEHPAIHPRIHAVTSKLSRNEWSWLLTGSALVLGLLSLAHGTLPVRKPWMRPATIATTAVALLFATLSTTALYLRRHDGNRAVVIAPDASIRLSPFDTAESLGTPKPGSIVLLGEQNGGYRFVSATGSTLAGWIAGNQIEAIEASPR